jgi:hypothetical protein
VKAPGIVLAVALAIAAAPAVARADNRADATRHFNAAKAAEQRGDYRVAVDEYQQAYDAAPHPTVLFNIGNAYERLGEPRHAAEFFTRYLADDPKADDRVAVEQRITRLAARPAKVTITSTPDGAAIFVDGTRAGAAPLTTTLDGGSHEIYAAANGRTTPVRRVQVGYGEPLLVEIDLRASLGVLTVTADVSGAEVRLDGELIGETPFTGAVLAGDHELLVSKPGYASVQRRALVPAEGSARVAVALMVLPDQVPAPETPGEGRKYLFQLEYGYDAVDAGFRYMLGFGMRTAGGGADVLFLLGVPTGSGVAYGGEVRLFPWQSRGRLFTALSAAIGSSATTGESGYGLAQLDLGFLIGGQSRASTSSTAALGIDYFVSVGLGARFGDTDGTELMIPLSIGGVLRRGS